MHIISIGLDPKTLNKESVVALRNRTYGKAVGKYSVIVPAKETIKVELSESTTAYGVAGAHKLIQLWGMYKLASTLIKEEGCDVITTQDTYFLGLLGVILSRKYHCGLEVQVLGIEKMNPIRRVLTQYVLKNTGSIRVLSRGLKERLVHEFGASDAHMMLVPIYVDVSKLGFNTEELSLDQKAELQKYTDGFREKYRTRFNILSVNRLVAIKNIFMQLDALVTLKKTHPQVLLHIVGEGPLQTQLQDYILSHGLSDNVLLHGFKSGLELSTFFTQCDCFVLTSDFEGYGMVIVEAATAGLPIVMTDVGCAGEVIIHQKSGMIVPPKDVKSLTEALELLIADEGLRERLSEAGRLSIAELPSFDTVLEKYKASWNLALQNRA